MGKSTTMRHICNIATSNKYKEKFNAHWRDKLVSTPESKVELILSDCIAGMYNFFSTENADSTLLLAALKNAKHSKYAIHRIIQDESIKSEKFKGTCKMTIIFNMNKSEINIIVHFSTMQLLKRFATTFTSNSSSDKFNDLICEIKKLEDAYLAL